MQRLPSETMGRRQVPLGWAAFAVALWLVALDNLSFWDGLLAAQGGRWWMDLPALAALFTTLLLLMTALLRLPTNVWAAKLTWVTLLLVSAIAAHFVDFWGALLDKGMLRSVMQTDFAEAADLMTTGFALDLALRGLLPSAAVLLVPMSSAKLGQHLGATLALGLAAAVSAAAAVAIFYPVYSTTFRNHRELRLQLIPSSFLSSLYGVLRTRAAPVVEPIAADASREPALTGKPLLLVLVVGETARADNFSMAGYSRPTNDALDNKQVIFFANVTSCGTDTASSLPCMFSNLGAADFSNEKAARRENALDVLQRTGVQVSWIENNSGCKGVCDRIPTIQAGEQCAQKPCLDDVLLPELQRRMEPSSADKLIVLHQQGSHGPAYFRRYPPPGRFQPTCTDNRIQNCSKQSLVNTYDNTIDYTSQVLGRAIDLLAQDRRYNSILLYVSDHGESLGERGVYLHGLPRLLAPHEQMHVPVLLWMSPGARSQLFPVANCLDRLRTRALSHDNLFHTLMGAFGVSAKAYAPELDIFALAKNPAACSAAGSVRPTHR